MFTEPLARKTLSSLKSVCKKCYILVLFLSRSTETYLLFVFKKAHQFKRSERERVGCAQRMGPRRARFTYTCSPTNCNQTNKAVGRTNVAERRQRATYKLFLCFLRAQCTARVAACLTELTIASRLGARMAARLLSMQRHRSERSAARHRRAAPHRTVIHTLFKILSAKCLQSYEENYNTLSENFKPVAVIDRGAPQHHVCTRAVGSCRE